MLNVRCWTLLTLLLSASPLFAEPPSGLHFRGSFFTDAGLNHFHHADSRDSVQFRGLSSLRLTFQNFNRKHAKVECNLDVNIPYGHYLDQLLASTGDTLALSLGSTLFELSDKAPVMVDLRKLYLSVYLPFADITMGRQIINFGKGFIFTPIDVFSSIELGDLAFRRSGTDIAMVAVPIGDRAGVDVVVELPFLDNTYSSALKAFATLGGWDLGAVCIYRNTDDHEGRRDETITGITFKGDIEIGVHGEIVAHFFDDIADPSFEAMLGADYSIRDRFVFMAEYLYKEYDLPGIGWGEHNAFGSAQYRINDIMSLSGMVIHNFSDALSMGILQYQYNIVQNADLIVYTRLYRGSPLYDAEYAVRANVAF